MDRGTNSRGPGRCSIDEALPPPLSGPGSGHCGEYPNSPHPATGRLWNSLCSPGGEHTCQREPWVLGTSWNHPPLSGSNGEIQSSLYNCYPPAFPAQPCSSHSAPACCPRTPHGIPSGQPLPWGRSSLPVWPTQLYITAATCILCPTLPCLPSSPSLVRCLAGIRSGLWALPVDVCTELYQKGLSGFEAPGAERLVSEAVLSILS